MARRRFRLYRGERGIYDNSRTDNNYRYSRLPRFARMRA